MTKAGAVRLVWRCRGAGWWLHCWHVWCVQVLSRAGQRSAKLADTLRVVRQNAAHVDDLLDWLADCHMLLAAKHKDSIPDDLTVVEALLHEHAVRTSAQVTSYSYSQQVVPPPLSCLRSFVTIATLCCHSVCCCPVSVRLSIRYKQMLY